MNGAPKAIKLTRLKDDTLVWKSIYVVDGTNLRVESRGEPNAPQYLEGWNLYELNGLNRSLVKMTDTLPEMRTFLNGYLNGKKNGNARNGKKKTSVPTKRITSTRKGR